MWAGLVVLAAVAWLQASPAGAVNSPTFRDCSFVAGLDPDFVQLSGVGAGPGGSLAVGMTQRSVTIEASESSDLFDDVGNDTLTVAVSGPGAAPRTVSAAGVGHVFLTVPLSGVAPGGQYTLTWFATFDNGIHTCPSPGTPQNESFNPFVLNVLSAPVVTTTPPLQLQPAPLTLTGLRESHRTWRPSGHPTSRRARRAPVGTEFSFELGRAAPVMLEFRQLLPGRRRGDRCIPPGRHPRGRRCTRSVTRGGLSITGSAGRNSVRFAGRIQHLPRLPAGNYMLVVTATNASGQSATRSIAFTIVG
jgi:hypothetical protein